MSQEGLKEPADVSIIQLIATPEAFHRKRIRAVGFVRIEFEGNAIYLHSEDAQNRITKNSIWLELPPEIKNDKKTFDGKFVVVQGTFDSTNKGHMRLSSGSIKDITRFQLWAESSKN